SKFNIIAITVSNKKFQEKCIIEGKRILLNIILHKTCGGFLKISWRVAIFLSFICKNPGGSVGQKRIKLLIGSCLFKTARTTNIQKRMLVQRNTLRLSSFFFAGLLYIVSLYADDVALFIKPTTYYPY
ncbi:hypothetical protein ACJX0J_007203, partial [Zea mays]